MRVLITGATGFIGANLARRMLCEGHDVHILARKESVFWRLKDVLDALHVHRANIQDRDDVTRTVSEAHPDWVFHLAVYGAYSFQSETQEILRSNILGTANLLEACEKVGFAAFVNTGSSSEYGFKTHAPAEDEPLEPNSHYAVGKAAATMLCRFIARRTSLPVATLRLYSVYGPYEEPRRLIPRLLRLGLVGRLPPLVSPEIAHDFVYVDDVVDAYLRAAMSSDLPSGAVYNIGSGTQTRIGEVVQLVSELLSISAEPHWNSMERRIWDTNTWVGNVERAAHELNWTSHTTLRDGLSATIKWMGNHLCEYPLEDQG